MTHQCGEWFEILTKKPNDSMWDRDQMGQIPFFLNHQLWQKKFSDLPKMRGIFCIFMQHKLAKFLYLSIQLEDGFSFRMITVLLMDNIRTGSPVHGKLGSVPGPDNDHISPIKALLKMISLQEIGICYNSLLGSSQLLPVRSKKSRNSTITESTSLRVETTPAKRRNVYC